MSHVWMSHVICKNKKDLIQNFFTCFEVPATPTWMSHVTRMNELGHTYDCACHTHEWVMSHIWLCLSHAQMSDVTQMNGSWHTHEWVMARTWMGHGTHMNGSWHTHEWVMAHTWMGHGTHINGSWHTHEWVMAHTWMGHGTHRNGSWHTHE